MPRNSNEIFSDLIKKIVCIIFLVKSSIALAQLPGKMDAIYSGTPWFDQNGKIVSVPAADISKDKGKFCLFGEAHSDASNAFERFYCYSSKDLYNWKFESEALPVQKSAKLGTNSVGERVKGMENPKTKEYGMFINADSITYKNQFVGFATSKIITSSYQFKGALLFRAKGHGYF